MAYVPGFSFDVFVSYAHGDDREWITRLVDRLESALKQRLGVKASIWIDDASLRKTRDFSKDIPHSVRSSATFLLLPSPTYIRSRYCIDQECRVFEKTVESRRTRFSALEFARELFALRCPIIPIEGNEHWTLFSGLTDIPFCNDTDTHAFGSPEFEASFRRLVSELVGLLKRMRNHCTSVFLYPPFPDPDLRDVHQALVAELSAHSYRILPDREVNLHDQLRNASMSVFLLGRDWDEASAELTDIAASQRDKPWVVWCSPTMDVAAAPDQVGFAAHIEQLNSSTKTFLNADIVPAKLKEEVLALLRPARHQAPGANGKPSVYLVYNARDRGEFRNAAQISYSFRKEVQFTHPDDPAQHTLRLAHSDGVLLVWGNATEDWCSREFEEMMQVSQGTRARGLCLFDPADTKGDAVTQIREIVPDLHIAEQFGDFNPARLTGFFDSLLRSQERGGP
jgi:hypothetical protein